VAWQCARGRYLVSVPANIGPVLQRVCRETAALRKGSA
jgi:hypothetical protein